MIIGPEDSHIYKSLLGNEEGLEISYAEQRPEGLAQAFIIGRSLSVAAEFVLFWGYIFYGDRIGRNTQNAASQRDVASVFAYYVNDPERYGCDS